MVLALGSTRRLTAQTFALCDIGLSDGRGVDSGDGPAALFAASLRTALIATREAARILA
jgi:hypothetical protein